MATIPSAITRVQDTAGARAGGTDLCCVIFPCATNADLTPRLFGSAEAIHAQHGYCEGVEYTALHIEKTRKSILGVGIPIVTVGTVGRFDTSGNTDTCTVTVSAGGDGVLAEHDGEWYVERGGTIGTDPILLSLSLDGGRTYKKVRLGTGTSYTDPYFGIVTTFGAGDLTAGETVATWHGSAPRGDATGWEDAREALAAQLKLFRSALLVGDVQNSTEANAFNTQLEAYETSNERFIYGRASVLDHLPLASLSGAHVSMSGAPSLTFSDGGLTGDQVERSAGSWTSDGFAVGDAVTITNSGANNITDKIVVVDAAELTLDDVVLVPGGPEAGITVTASTGLTFVAAADTITRSRGSWFADGFRDGDTVTITGTSGATNDGTFVIDALTATVMTLVTGGVDANEFAAASAVSITTGTTKTAWMATIDAAFVAVDAKKRIDLSAGRGRVRSPFTAWHMRRPAGWFASLREYQHDLHIAPWRKDDGPTDADLFDEDGVLAEWDDRVYGGAGSAARFTTLRTWANGPAGGFVTLSLTRASEASVLSYTHNVAVTNLACQTVQLNTELAAVGQTPTLNDDGTATAEALSTIKSRVDSALKLALLTNAKGEGPRASSVEWVPATDDVLNVPEAVLNGVVLLNLNGTIHSVSTTVRVQSGGV
jgi:hypothetical protein